MISAISVIAWFLSTESTGIYNNTSIHYNSLLMITILAVTDGFKHFGEAISEYGKRLGKTINLKPIKPISHTNPEYIKIKETLLIIETLRKIK
jgi:hypothetical protein